MSVSLQRTCTPSSGTKHAWVRVGSLAAIVFLVVLAPQVAGAATPTTVGGGVNLPNPTVCALSQIDVGKTEEIGASGIGVLLVPLTDRSNGTCTVKGYPVIKMFSPKNRPLPVRVVNTRTPISVLQFGTPKTVSLSSARAGYFAISFVDGGSLCVRAGHLDIGLKSKQPAAITVPLLTGGLSLCEGFLDVSPFVTRDPLVGA